MRKIFLIIGILGVLSMFTSCSSFLEEDPQDQHTTDNFYQSEKDAIAGVTAVYQQLYSIYTRNMFIMSALPADDEKNGLGMPNQFLQNLEYLRFTSENDFIRTMWEINYQGINKANTAIENIPNITMDDGLKERLIGEAKFLRALFYFNLVRFYGDVPIILDLETVEDAYLERSPKDAVYSQIIQDLEDAAATTDTFYDGSDLGRVTKGAALILLGKVYLTMHQYQKSVETLAEVIENEGTYGYGLLEEFGDNWKPETENGRESVLTIEYMDPPGTGNTAMLLSGPKYSIDGGFSVLGLSNSNEADIPTMDLYSQFLDGDKRKATTFRTDFVSLIDGSVHTSSIPIFVKYWEEGESNPSQSDCNFHVLRYADALLMYAEVLNETNRTADALQHLNRVRARAFKSNDYNYYSLSQEDCRTAIWQERRLELAYEGHRWFDLTRTGRFLDRMKEHANVEASLAEKNKIEIATNIKDYMVLMPIPQREIDLNPKLTQNQGY